MLATPSKFHTFGEFFRFFVPSLTGVVAFWATVALNIPDFTRYARGQKEQILGQALGLPTTMTFYAFIGIAVTSATVVVFGQAIWDPVQVLSRLGNPWAVVVAMVGLLVATLNVNVAANVVSPSNDFSNLWPRRISFRMGGVITCLVGLLMQPWKLLASYGTYITGWLVGYSSFLGPIAGVLIADYYVLRKKIMLPEDLYQRGGFYEFSRGVNWRAVWALVAGILVALVGLVARPLAGAGHAGWVRSAAEIVGRFYDYAWFVGFGVSFLVYLGLMRRGNPAAK
jgi:NCS1 family nucleobase:cation symporter-1